METKELIKSVLDKWGFPVLKEEENSLVFRYQMSFVQANVCGNEENLSVAVTLAGIFHADDEKEKHVALRTCNDLNYNLFQTKLYLDFEDDLILASEFFYRTPEDMEYLLTNALQGLVVAKKRFGPKYKEFLEEENLLEEMGQDIDI